MKKFLASCCLAVAVANPAQAGLADFFNGVKIGAPLPDSDLQFLGPPAAIAGHVVLIDFWATWCEPCRTSIPMLNALHAKFSPKGLVIVGVSQESKAEVAAFLEQLPMSYATAVEGPKDLQKALHIRGLPYAILVDRAGTIVWRGQPADLTDEFIDATLAK